MRSPESTGGPEARAVPWAGNTSNKGTCVWQSELFDGFPAFVRLRRLIWLCQEGV